MQEVTFNGYNTQIGIIKITPVVQEFYFYRAVGLQVELPRDSVCITKDHVRNQTLRPQLRSSGGVAQQSELRCSPGEASAQV